MRQAKIFRYQRDRTQSFHRIVDGEEKTGILTYYENHVYMDSDFVPAGSVQYITRDSLLAKYRRDMDRVDRRFDILREFFLRGIAIYWTWDVDMGRSSHNGWLMGLAMHTELNFLRPPVRFLLCQATLCGGM